MARNDVAYTITVSVCALAIGYMAGLSTFASRVSSLEAGQKEITALKEDMRSLRHDVTKISVKLGVVPDVAVNVSRAAGLSYVSR